MAQFNGTVKKVVSLNNCGAKSFLTLKNSVFQFFPPIDLSKVCKSGDNIIVTTTEIKKGAPKAIQPSQIISIKIGSGTKSIFNKWRRLINF